MSAQDIVQAKRNASTARARVDSTLGALKYRLNPRTIAANAVDDAKEKTALITSQAAETVRERPRAAGAAAGLVGLVLLRKPIGRLTRKLFRRKRKDVHAGNGADPSPALTQDETGEFPIPPAAATRGNAASARQE